MSGVFGFIAKMGIAKIGGIGQSAAAALAKFDPETASQVDIDNLDAEFKRVGDMVARAEPEEERTHHLVNDLETRLARTKAAATMLSDKITIMTTAGDTAQVQMLTTQLMPLITQIEEIGGPSGDGKEAGLLFDAIQDHDLAESDLHELKQLHSGSAAALAGAETRLRKARDDMARAGRQEAIAREREGRAEQMAGIRKGLSGDSIALQAMEQQAAESKRRSRAASLNASALTHITEASASADDIVARTLAGATAEESAQDKLARLLGKKVA